MSEQQTYEIFSQPDEGPGTIWDVVWALHGIGKMMNDWSNTGNDLDGDTTTGISFAIMMLSDKLCRNVCCWPPDKREKINEFIRTLNEAEKVGNEPYEPALSACEVATAEISSDRKH